MNRGKKCIIIGAGISTTPARLVLINADVNDDYVMLVSVSSDAINALAEFARHVYQDLKVKVRSIFKRGLGLINVVAMLRALLKLLYPVT